MTNRFTQKAQQVLNLALRYASRMGHTYIGSEHLLLGLLGEESGVASHFLRERGADMEKIQNAIEERSGLGTPTVLSASDMTPRTKSIIESSLQESIRNGQDYIGTEHLLLALLNVEDCVAVECLESIGVSAEDLKQDILNFLRNSADRPGSPIRHWSIHGGDGEATEKSRKNGGIVLSNEDALLLYYLAPERTPVKIAD